MASLVSSPIKAANKFSYCVIKANKDDNDDNDDNDEEVWTKFSPILRGKRMQPNEDTTMSGTTILEEYMFFFVFFAR